jgi:Flp pilus assembly protein TadG
MTFRSAIRRDPRRGAMLVEAALVLPILFLFIIGTVLVGLGIFRYQQVAGLAREGARYAVVHGAQYASETGNTAASASDILTVIKNKAVGLDLNSLNATVTWQTSNSPNSANAASSPPGAPMRNLVTVTVTYTWSPSIIGVGTLNLSSTSTSVMPMSY